MPGRSGDGRCAGARRVEPGERQPTGSSRAIAAPDATGDSLSAAGRVAEGEYDEQFPIDVFQTGSGTSSNMNANEVIATLAGEGVHRNDDVNMGQSSNDVFPSAVHLAALDTATHDLLPVLVQL